MPRVPIIRLGDVLIVTLIEDLRDDEALDLQEEIVRTLEQTGARGVLLDYSVVQTVDSFLGRLLGDIATAARLMGAHTVAVGIQPAVAITLIELGVDLRGMHSALNSEKGLALLRSLLRREVARGFRGSR